MSTIEGNVTQSITSLPLAQSTTLMEAKATPRAKAGRLFFLDNLRWALTILVILHHLAITYGASGSWYYIEEPTTELATILLTLFAGLNQGYFMGLFFLIAGYFVPASLDQKGTAHFLKDRAIRLGIPLLLYAVLLSPMLNSFNQIVTTGGNLSVASLWAASVERWQNFDFSPGPLWFVEALFLFSAIYALGVLAMRAIANKQSTPIHLTNSKLVIVAIVIALLSFATRLVYPIGTEWGHFQLAFFPQYIAFFGAGILAYRNQWLTNLPEKIHSTWQTIAIVAVFALPAMMMLPGVQENFDAVMGGWHLYAFLFATWEGFYGLAMSITLLGVFRLYFNRNGGLSRLLTTNAYAAYIIHPPVLILLAYSLHAIAINPLLKYGLLTLPAVGLTFALAYLLVEYVPGAKKIL